LTTTSFLPRRWSVARKVADGDVVEAVVADGPDGVAGADADGNIVVAMNEIAGDDGKLDGVLQVLITMRKEAKNRKDYVTSDKIRNELASLGILLKDEKDGSMSYVFV